jgi:hypothetical protein
VVHVALTKNRTDGLLAIFYGAHNLELLTERLAHSCDRLLVIISEHHTNLAHGNPPENKDTHDQIVLLADLSLLSLATVPLGAIYRKPRLFKYWRNTRDSP